MKDWPDSFWASIFITEALIVAVLALYSPAKDNIILAVLGLGSNAVTGAFAYIQGKKAAESAKPQVITPPPEGNPQP